MRLKPGKRRARKARKNTRPRFRVELFAATLIAPVYCFACCEIQFSTSKSKTSSGPAVEDLIMKGVKVELVRLQSLVGAIAWRRAENRNGKFYFVTLVSLVV